MDDIISSCEATVSLPATVYVFWLSSQGSRGFSFRPHGESVCLGNVKFSSFSGDGVSLFDRTIVASFPYLKLISKAALCQPAALPPSLPPFLLPPVLSPFCLPHPAPPVCAFLNFNHLIFNTFHSGSSQGYPGFQKRSLRLLRLNLNKDSLISESSTVFITWLRDTRLTLALDADFKSPPLPHEKNKSSKKQEERK